MLRLRPFNLRPHNLPLIAGGVGVVSPLLMAAAPADAMAAAAGAFVLTGNPLIDALIIAAITGPIAAGAAWLLKLITGTTLAAISAAAEAYAKTIRAKAKATKDPSDDAPADALAAGIEAGAKRLRELDDRDRREKTSE